MNNSKSFETILGGTTLIFIFYLIYFFLGQLTILKPSIKEQYTTYKASFTDIDGINVGSYVKIGGVSIGNVKQISINPESYKIVVGFSVLSKYKIPDDTSVSISTAGFMGEKSLQLSMGMSDKYLNEDDEIIYTQSSLTLEKLISFFKK
jgi:phospholipid/cholesterol/gamma-HCH transport system substrate-binding protein